MRASPLCECGQFDSLAAFPSLTYRTGAERLQPGLGATIATLKTVASSSRFRPGGAIACRGTVHDEAGVSRGPTDIEAYIARFAAPPADQLADFVAAGRSRSLAPGEPFCRLGQERHELAFIHEGIVRYYVVLPDGDEATKDFSFAPSFTVSFGSAAAGRPAAVAIAAVTACRLSVWPYAAMLALYERHAEWQKLGRLLAEVLYARKERREISFLLESAETRYRKALRAFPSEIAQIPQYHLASYLGIRPQSLSRLRKRVGMNLGE
jgi:CRP-like cAMP-binding protein